MTTRVSPRISSLPAERAERELTETQHGTPPGSPPSTVTVIRFETPRKSATKTVCGSSYISAGVATCSTRPLDITAMRSDIVSASSWSCVT